MIDLLLVKSGPKERGKCIRRPIDAPAYEPEVFRATLANVLLALEPRAVMAVMQTTTIRASITAYSTAVGPSSFRRNSRTACRLNMDANPLRLRAAGGRARPGLTSHPTEEVRPERDSGDGTQAPAVCGGAQRSFSIPSAAWRPCPRGRGAHSFASPPYDGFAIVEDEEVQSMSSVPNAASSWATACIRQTGSRSKARSGGMGSQIADGIFCATGARGARRGARDLPQKGRATE